MHAVRRKVVILLLFTVGNDRGTRRFELRDRVSNRSFIERSERGIIRVAFCDAFNQIDREKLKRGAEALLGFGATSPSRGFKGDWTSAGS